MSTMLDTMARIIAEPVEDRRPDPIEVSIDSAGHVLINGERNGHRLTRTPAKTLRLILASQGVVTRDFLLSALYSHPDNEPDVKIIDIWLCKVRKALGEHREAVETIWGRGFMRHRNYRWVDPADDGMHLLVPAVLIEELCMAMGKNPDEVIYTIVKQAHRQIVLGEDN
jgi:DNA-binding winged helix-turn-helix (wHTH) protein